MCVGPQAGVVGLLKGSQVARFALPAPEAARPASTGAGRQAHDLQMPAPPIPNLKSTSASPAPLGTPPAPQLIQAPTPVSHTAKPQRDSEGNEQRPLGSEPPSAPTVTAPRQQVADPHPPSPPRPIMLPGLPPKSSDASSRSDQTASDQQRSSAEADQSIRSASSQSLPRATAQADEQGTSRADEPAALSQTEQQAAPAAVQEDSQEADDKEAATSGPDTSHDALVADPAEPTLSQQSELRPQLADEQPPGSDQTQSKASPSLDQQLVPNEAENGTIDSSRSGVKPSASDTAGQQAALQGEVTQIAALADPSDLSAHDDNSLQVAPAEDLSVVDDAESDGTAAARQSPAEQHVSAKDNVDAAGSQQGEWPQGKPAQSSAASASPSQPAFSAGGDDQAAAGPDEARQAGLGKQQQLDRVTAEAAADLLQQSSILSQSPDSAAASRQNPGATQATQDKQDRKPKLSEGSSVILIPGDADDAHSSGNLQPAALQQQKPSQAAEQQPAARSLSPSAASGGMLAGRATDASQQGAEQTQASSGLNTASDKINLSAIPGAAQYAAKGASGSTKLSVDTKSRTVSQVRKPAAISSPTGLGVQGARQDVNEPKMVQTEAKVPPSPRTSAAKMRQNAEMKRQQTTFNPLG